MPHNSFACYICNELGTVKDGKSNDFYELTIATYEKRCGNTMFAWLKRPKKQVPEGIDFGNRLNIRVDYNI